MSVGVIIPAAGQGKRMGSTESKQFLSLHQRPIVLHTIDVFEKHPDVEELVIVTRESEIARMHDLIEQQSYQTEIRLVVGGNERQESVCCGVQEVKSEWVMVHDAVRPFVTQEAITRLISAIKEYDAAILAVPVKDTIKQIEANQVNGTLDRSKLWSIQTPQGFQRELLLRAHFQASGNHATDDSALVERLGVKVHVVDGEYTNIKITTPEDLIFAEAIFQMKGKRHDSNWARL